MGKVVLFMNKLMIASLLLLTSCASEFWDGKPQKYYTNPPVNKVGPNGELISPAGCPDWTASPYSTYENGQQGNFGCATVTNLGLMLVDPRDLERGSSGGHIPPDMNRAGKAIERYRSGVPAEIGAEATNPLAPVPVGE